MRCRRVLQLRLPLLFSLLALAATGRLSSLSAQVGAPAADDPPAEGFALSNSSFEDIPRQGHPPRGWYDCGFPNETPVDVHPAALAPEDTANFFGVDNRPHDGNTYLGMVVRDNDTYEAVSQRLNFGRLEAGQCYTFSVYLARETGYFSASKANANQVVNYNTPAKLRIWGGSSYCNRGEIIAESAPVENAEWVEYTFRFEPKLDHNYIVLEAYYKTPVLFAYNGNLLLDYAGKIEPVLCDEEEVTEPEVLAEADEPAPAAVAEADPTPVAEADDSALASVAEAGEPTPAAPVTPVRPAPEAPAESEAKLQGLSRQQLRRGSVVRVEKLYFKADSSVVTETSTDVLEEIYSFLEANPDVIIEVGGHTNTIPEHDFADQLSAARAQAVVDYLVGRGIDEARLRAKGYGKRKPVTHVKTAGAQRRNQRVELTVLSIG